MTWDGENRLVKLERPAWTQPTGGFMAPANPQGIPPNELSAMTIEFKYDGLSRLVERKVTRGIDAPEVEGHQWDGWKLIMIAKLNTNGTFHSRKWSCVWRPDIGSSLYARSEWMRAGGVGGVAWLQTGAVQSYSYGTGGAEVHVPLADHMGNVRHYYQFKASGSKVTGQLVASYEYDAFGREVRAWGLNTPATNQPPGPPASRPWADLLPFHYSSKLRDVDSGFNYYGYRFYDPGAGRWLNRDPIEEAGGVNLYGMVGNDAVERLDVLGKDAWSDVRAGIHYELGLGEAVSLAETGLVDQVTVATASDRAALLEELEYDIGRWRARSKCDDYINTVRLPAHDRKTGAERFYSRTAHSGVFWIGRFNLDMRATCNVLYKCNTCKICYACRVEYKMRDKFKEPLDIDNSDDDFWDDIETDVPFDVFHTWNETVKKCIDL